MAVGVRFIEPEIAGSINQNRYSGSSLTQSFCRAQGRARLPVRGFSAISKWSPYNFQIDNQKMSKRITDIRIEYYRSRGPGGQRKNKKETAVRIRHIPTGITAIATESRSQARNRQLALKRLNERLERLKRKKKRRIPTRISVSAKERILKKKRLRSEKKKLRHKIIVE